MMPAVNVTKNASGKAISHGRTEGITKTIYDPISKKVSKKCLFEWMNRTSNKFYNTSK